MTFKATIDQSALLKCLVRVKSAVSKRAPIPILGNVLIKAGSGKLSFRSTDMDVEITDTVTAAVDGSGETTVPAHLLHDVVRKMPTGAQIMIEDDGANVIVKSGRSRFKVPALPASDFPDLGGAINGVEFDLAGDDLRKLIGKTEFAICTEETRYYLNGIYLHVAEDGDFKLRAVATDGHRLARVDVGLPDGVDSFVGMIVPRKAVAEVKKLFDEAEVVSLEVGQNKISFAAGSVRLTSKLIDGTFPDYRRVIPQNNDKRLEVEKAALADAVDRVSTVLDGNSRCVKFAITPGHVDLSVASAESGSAADEVDADYSGEPLEIGFNARYVDSMLAQIGGEKAVFQLADPGSPTIIKDSGDDSVLFVLMPMRT